MPLDWHTRYLQQAAWTRPLREHLLSQAALPENASILEVGCGTGAVLEEFIALGNLYGLDIDPTHLEITKTNVPGSALIQGDAYSLPYPAGAFDLVFCHFLLLWLDDPVEALSEMRRITKPGGLVIAFAEPDYGGRIDYPPELEIIGEMQRESLRRQGAEPLTGRQLGAFFVAAGLPLRETGILGAQRRPTRDAMVESDAEWQVVVEDYARLLELGEIPITHAELETLRLLEERSRMSGERVLFVPTFYAVGTR